MRRRVTWAMVAVVLTSALIGAPTARGARAADPTKDRERVRQQRAELVEQLDVQRASLAKIDQAVQDLNADIATQSALLAHANDQLGDVERAVERSDEAIVRSKSRIARLRSQMRARAIAAYVSPPANDAIDLLGVRSVRIATYRRMYARVRAADDADLADQFKGAELDLEFVRRQAASARALAKRRQSQLQARTEKLTASRNRERRFAAALKRRIASSVASAIRLSRVDRALSSRIAFEQAALAARLEAARVAVEQAANRNKAKAEARAAAVAAAKHDTLRPNGSESAPLPSAPPPPVAVSAVSTASGISLTTVNGITVNSQIGGSLTSLVAAARSSGLNLTGGGYRSSSEQISLRASHCGSSYFALYQMSAGSCHPPTAPPGRSMHELGLAIDFSNCGSHSTACYQWLAANGSRFGFFNLPSEPWHWSINGN